MSLSGGRKKRSSRSDEDGCPGFSASSLQSSLTADSELRPGGIGLIGKSRLCPAQ